MRSECDLAVEIAGCTEQGFGFYTLELPPGNALAPALHDLTAFALQDPKRALPDEGLSRGTSLRMERVSRLP